MNINSNGFILTPRLCNNPCSTANIDPEKQNPQWKADIDTEDKHLKKHENKITKKSVTLHIHDKNIHKNIDHP